MAMAPPEVIDRRRRREPANMRIARWLKSAGRWWNMK
jgi:hypothetical protein